jgi:hypothetical protein
VVGLVGKVLSISSHLLLVLLVLEAFTLVSIVALAQVPLRQLSTLSTILLLFTFAVAEARLGLSVLITAARATGGDLLQLF